MCVIYLEAPWHASTNIKKREKELQQQASSSQFHGMDAQSPPQVSDYSKQRCRQQVEL